MPKFLAGILSLALISYGNVAPVQVVHVPVEIPQREIFSSHAIVPPSLMAIRVLGTVLIGSLVMAFVSERLTGSTLPIRPAGYRTLGSSQTDRKRRASEILEEDFGVTARERDGRTFVQAEEIPSSEWVMSEMRERQNGFIYPFEQAPNVTLSYPLQDLPLLSLKNPGLSSQNVYMGFIDGVSHPVEIKIMLQNASQSDLATAFQKAQIGYLLGTNPKVYGIVRTEDGLIGYAMDICRGEVAPLEPALQEENLRVIAAYKEIGLNPPSILVTPEGKLVYIDAGNLGVREPNRYKEFLASKTPPAFPARGSLWPYVVSRSISLAARNAWTAIISYLAVRDPRALKPGPKALVVFGSDLLKVAESAADFYHAHHPEFVLVSGGTGGRTGAPGRQSEAERFADVLYARGVPFEKVLLEKEASNSGENARYSVQLLLQRGFSGDIVLMQKPTDQRRAGLTLRHELDNANMENIEVFDWAPFIPSLEEPLEGYSADEWSHRLFFDAIGEIFRLLHYPEKGYFAAEPVAADVLSAVPALYDQLKSHPSIATSQKQALQEMWSVISSRSGLESDALVHGDSPIRRSSRAQAPDWVFIALNIDPAASDATKVKQLESLFNVSALIEVVGRLKAAAKDQPASEIMKVWAFIASHYPPAERLEILENASVEPLKRLARCLIEVWMPERTEIHSFLMLQLTSDYSERVFRVWLEKYPLLLPLKALPFSLWRIYLFSFFRTEKGGAFLPLGGVLFRMAEDLAFVEFRERALQTNEGLRSILDAHGISLRGHTRIADFAELMERLTPEIYRAYLAALSPIARLLEEYSRTQPYVMMNGLPKLAGPITVAGPNPDQRWTEELATAVLAKLELASWPELQDYLLRRSA